MIAIHMSTVVLCYYCFVPIILLLCKINYFCCESEAVRKLKNFKSFIENKQYGNKFFRMFKLK